MRHRLIQLSAAVAVVLFTGSCSSVRYNPEKATRPYPLSLHGPTTPVDIQVFREEETLRLVNATTTGYRNFDLWLNQRYMKHVDSFGPGETLTVHLGDFWDQWGGSPNPGGLLKRFEPTPIRLAEIQVDGTTPLVGLVTLRAEPAE